MCNGLDIKFTLIANGDRAIYNAIKFSWISAIVAGPACRLSFSTDFNVGAFWYDQRSFMRLI